MRVVQDEWKKFEIFDMHGYYDLYLKTDVLLLADFFESFRKVSMANYGLEPLHYYSAPGLSWETMLKNTSVKLELFTEPEHLVEHLATMSLPSSFCCLPVPEKKLMY